MRVLFLTAFIVFLGCSDESSNPNPPVTTNNATNNVTTIPDWVWTPIEESKCGKGTEAGIGILDGADKKRMVLYFEGGGACWDTASCYLLNAAVNIEKNYGEADFKGAIQAVSSHPLFDKHTGPFGDVPMVFVPYCTGDLHSGNSVGSYDPLKPDRKIHHNGGKNVALYLSHLKAKYPNLEEIFVVGVSAGGYGAMMNHHRFRATFPGVPIHVLADGAPLIQPRDNRWAEWKDAWKFEYASGCTECETTFNAFAEDAISAGVGRISLLTFYDDAVIAVYFGYTSGMKAAVTNVLATFPGQPGQNASAFTKEGTDHVMLQFYENLKDDEGQSLKAFIKAWVNPMTL